MSFGSAIMKNCVTLGRLFIYFHESILIDYGVHLGLPLVSTELTQRTVKLLFFFFLVQWCYFYCVLSFHVLQHQQVINSCLLICSLQRRYAFWHHSEILVLLRSYLDPRHLNEVRHKNTAITIWFYSVA